MSYDLYMVDGVRFAHHVKALLNSLQAVPEDASPKKRAARDDPMLLDAPPEPSLKRPFWKRFFR